MGYIPGPPPLPGFYSNTHTSAMMPGAFDVWMQRIDDFLSKNVTCASVSMKALRCPQCGAPLESAYECRYCGAQFEMRGFMKLHTEEEFL